MTIGQRIAQKRKEQGLSQEALGDRLGVSRQSIYKWESGSALPEIDKLVALSRLFGVSVGWLLGVEEDAVSSEANPTENGGELTDAQLKMVEEITERYTAALPAPKKSAWDKWSVRILFAICGLILGCLLGINGTVKKLEDQYGSLQNNVSQVQHSVDRQIGTITNRVEEILKAQNDLTADYGTEIDFTNFANNYISFSVYAVPKDYVEGMQAEFYADNGSGEKVPAVLVSYPESGEKFSANVKCELTDSITLSVVFVYPDGTRRTQLLDTYEYLYSESMPLGDVSDNLMWKDLEEPGVLVLAEEHERHVDVRQEIFNSTMPVPAVADIRVGLFQNQKLVAWAEPCEQPESYHGDWSNTRFFRLPEVRLSLAADDLIQTAAVVTDEYGRVTVWSGTPYILDQEAMALTWPTSSTLDSDPSHWEFE